tara:strand:+ start:98 stop:598 length:501 start_codon:yes stop_codon:yes gene_type:complete
MSVTNKGFIMNDLIKNVDGGMVTTSKVVADSFGKIHKDVLSSIRRLECSDDFRRRNFTLSSYTSLQNKVLPCYEITRDGFSMLCMGFTGDKAALWKERYIEAFNTMELGLLNVDSRINSLTLKGRELDRCGKDWSALGHEIRKQRRAHEASSQKLLGDVQLALELI